MSESKSALTAQLQALKESAALLEKQLNNTESQLLTATQMEQDSQRHLKASEELEESLQKLGKNLESGEIDIEEAGKSIQSLMKTREQLKDGGGGGGPSSSATLNSDDASRIQSGGEGIESERKSSKEIGGNHNSDSGPLGPGTGAGVNSKNSMSSTSDLIKELKRYKQTERLLFQKDLAAEVIPKPDEDRPSNADTIVAAMRQLEMEAGARIPTSSGETGTNLNAEGDINYSDLSEEQLEKNLLSLKEEHLKSTKFLQTLAKLNADLDKLSSQNDNDIVDLKKEKENINNLCTSNKNLNSTGKLAQKDEVESDLVDDDLSENEEEDPDRPVTLRELEELKKVSDAVEMLKKMHLEAEGVSGDRDSMNIPSSLDRIMNDASNMHKDILGNLLGNNYSTGDDKDASLDNYDFNPKSRIHGVDSSNIIDDPNNSDSLLTKPIHEYSEQELDEILAENERRYDLLKQSIGMVGGAINKNLAEGNNAEDYENLDEDTKAALAKLEALKSENGIGDMEGFDLGKDYSALGGGGNEEEGNGGESSSPEKEQGRSKVKDYNACREMLVRLRDGLEDPSALDDLLLEATAVEEKESDLRDMLASKK